MRVCLLSKLDTIAIVFLIILTNMVRSGASVGLLPAIPVPLVGLGTIDLEAVGNLRDACLAPYGITEVFLLQYLLLLVREALPTKFIHLIVPLCTRRTLVTGLAHL